MHSSLFTLACISLLAIAIRCSVMLHPHSGMEKPPMYGDFEAQRHWMELTVNLPVSEWYQHTEDNDLMYWGLDYPPLTAWHSLALGWVGRYFEPESMALYTSRGYATDSFKLFMRLSVLFTDVLLFFTGAMAACIAYDKCERKKADKEEKVKEKVSISNLSFHYAILLFSPAFILIDHGHFQYNTVSLGLTLWAVAAILMDFDVVGSVLYCLALNHKQMSLYHAPAFFCYLLAKSCHNHNVEWKSAVYNVLKLGIAVVCTFAVCWVPAAASIATAQQILHRLFPFARGMFEDKVANFWCAASPILRVREWLTRDSQVLLTSVTTLLSLLPSCLNLLKPSISPSPRNFILSLFTSAMAFFMFSFQVHEKTILIVLLPVLLLWRVSEWRMSVCGFALVCTFSMFQLMVKDGLVVAYVGCMAFFLVLVAAYSQMNGESNASAMDMDVLGFKVSLGIVGVGHLIHVCFTVLLPDSAIVTRFPDISSLAISMLCASYFLACMVAAWVWQWRRPDSDHVKYKLL